MMNLGREGAGLFERQLGCSLQTRQNRFQRQIGMGCWRCHPSDLTQFDISANRHFVHGPGRQFADPLFDQTLCRRTRVFGDAFGQGAELPFTGYQIQCP